VAFLGVDVGGTFTDAVLPDEDGLRTANVPTAARQEESVLAAVEALGADAPQVERLRQGTTIATLFSFRHPEHERAVEEELRRRHPTAYVVVASRKVSPDFREYERASTTVPDPHLGRSNPTSHSGRTPGRRRPRFNGLEGLWGCTPRWAAQRRRPPQPACSGRRDRIAS
jgi:N-methylhydantoinase A/oxoprolinase/acetone carboxylase beta subunit